MGEWGKRATVATKRLSDGKIIPEMEEEQSSSSDAKKHVPDKHTGLAKV